tara:strand:+ start:73 stop:264 length:192 start_codon:yes stop_codon:yes gene_type:complete
MPLYRATLLDGDDRMEDSTDHLIRAATKAKARAMATPSIRITLATAEDVLEVMESGEGVLGDE